MVNSTIRHRDERLDSLKGFLILLVILGHVIGETGASTRYPEVGGGVRICIYLFHMPLFVLLSGYFSKIKKDTKEFLFSISGIAITLFIFQTINILLLVIMQDFSWTYLVMPYWTLWYLLSLIFWRLALQYAPGLLLKRRLLFLILAVTVSLLSGLISHGRIFSVQRTLTFFPYFLLGYYMGQGRMTIPINKYTKTVSLVVIAAIIAMVIMKLYPSKTNLLLLGADHYTFHDIPAKIFLLICSFSMSLAVYCLAREIKILNYFGQQSLFFYVYHGILIQFIFIPIQQLLDFPINFSLIIIDSALVTVCLMLMSRIPLFVRLVKPEFKHKKK